MSEFARIASTMVIVLLVTGVLGVYVIWRAAWVLGWSRRTQRWCGAALLLGLIAAIGGRSLPSTWSLSAEVLGEAGTDVLLNRHVLIGQGRDALVLAGLDDVAGPRFDSPGPRLDLAFADAPQDLPRVLLSHNPAFFPKSHAYADLTLSGHTHGGQVTLFINPAELVLRHGYIRGHYHFEDSQLYVNRGFGTAGPPVRIGSPPEVTKLVLHV